MTDPTGFVPDGSPISYIVPAAGALEGTDPTGFVPPAAPFSYVVPDGPADGHRDDGGGPPKLPGGA